MEINGVSIVYLGHSGFLINDNGKIIAIDPFNLPDNVPKADLILITHSHYDHCSIKDIYKIVKNGTTMIIPPDVQSKITRINGINMQIIVEGDEISYGNLRISAVLAYNVEKKFHTKKDGWLGFVIKTGNIVIYHAGDTDIIPEMKKLTGYGKKGVHFIALLPVGGKFTMDFQEAAEAASILKPEIAVPMHYGSGIAGTLDDAKNFVEICKEKKIHAEILEKK